MKNYLPWKDIAGIGALLIIILLVIKYVPLDPTKEEVIKEQEEIIHFEEESSLKIDKETITVITPNNNLEITSPSFDIIKADEDGLVIAGRAKKFSEVTILRGDEVITKVQANQFGEFVYITEEPLNPGTYELRLLAWAGLMLVSLLVSMGIVELFISITNLEILNKPLYPQKTSLSLSDILIIVLFIYLFDKKWYGKE